MRLLTVALVAALAGCEEKARPWSQGDGPPAVLAPVPGGGAGTPGTGGSDPTESSGEPATDPPQNSSSGKVSSAPVPTTTGDGGPPGDTPATAATDGPPGERAKVTPGGGWVKCHEGLTLSGDPLKDVTRLGLLCGPSNGMRRKSRQAIVGLVGEREPPVTVTLQAVRGACYRIFAAAGAQVGELDVIVRSSRDVSVAADHRDGRLAIVQPDRPFCTFGDETFTVEVSARRGSGRFAAEVWALGEPVKRRDLMESPPDEPPIDKP